MGMTPQVRANQGQGISKRGGGLNVPSGLARGNALMNRQRMREQRDDREQAEQGRGRAGNGHIGPLSLGFDA